MKKGKDVALVSLAVHLFQYSYNISCINHCFTDTGFLNKYAIFSTAKYLYQSVWFGSLLLALCQIVLEFTVYDLQEFALLLFAAPSDEEDERNIDEPHYVELSDCPCDLTKRGCDRDCCCDSVSVLVAQYLIT